MTAHDATDVDEPMHTAASAPTGHAVPDDRSEARYWALVDGQQGPVHIGSPGRFPPPQSLCGHRCNGLQWANSRLWLVPADPAPIGVCSDCWERIDKVAENATTSQARSRTR